MFPCIICSGSLLAAPLWAAFILADDPAIAALCLLGEYLTAECWFGPTLASLFSVVPKNRRGVSYHPTLFSSLNYLFIVPVIIVQQLLFFQLFFLRNGASKQQIKLSYSYDRHNTTYSFMGKNTPHTTYSYC